MTLVGYWPLDEASGATTARDIVGNSDGSINGPSAASATGPFGRNAYSFDGTDDNISVSSPPQPSPLTYAVWVKADSLGESTPSYRTILSNNSRPALTYDVSDDQWKFVDEANNPLSIAEPQADIEGKWRFLAATIDSGGGELFVYGDSSIIGSSSGTFSSSYGGTTLRFGDWGDNSRHWNGIIAHVRIYNRTLSTQEISYLYEAPQSASVRFSSKTSP